MSASFQKTVSKILCKKIEIAIKYLESKNKKPLSLSVVGGVANNEFTLIIAASTTAAYTFNTAVYDIEIEKDNEVTRLLQGKIKLSKEVTI